jgi:predicted nucleic acid-binding protein
MRIASDTNVLAYAEGANGAIMRDKALKLIQRLPPGAIVLPAQTLGELTTRNPAHSPHLRHGNESRNN